MLKAKWPRLLAFAASFLVLESAAWAQRGYVSKPPLNPSQALSLEEAIVILGIPALAIFIGIFVYFYRRRSNTREM